MVLFSIFYSFFLSLNWFYFSSLTLVDSISVSVRSKYQSFTPSGCKNIGLKVCDKDSIPFLSFKLHVECRLFILNVVKTGQDWTYCSHEPNFYTFLILHLKTFFIFILQVLNCYKNLISSLEPFLNYIFLNLSKSSKMFWFGKKDIKPKNCIF